MTTSRPNKLLDDPRSDFKVAFYVHPSSDLTACWHIDLTSFETNSRNPMKRKVSDDQIPLLEERPRTRRSMILENPSLTEHLGSNGENGKETGDKESSASAVPKNESLEARSIDDLCSALQRLDWSKDDTEESQRTLGYLLYQEMYTYEVHVSDHSAEVARNSDSLDRILSDVPSHDYIKTQVMYPYQRLRLAYVLSLSLLRLYPSPWLGVKDRWASSNVRFFLTHLSPEKCVITPHIKGPCHGEEERSGAVRSLVKNYQIYALGVILLEIATGKPIDTSVIPGDHDYETKEFLAALKYNNEGIVTEALGSRYGDIVSRCLLFKFEGVESDLRKEELQRAFYEDVKYNSSSTGLSFSLESAYSHRTLVLTVGVRREGLEHRPASTLGIEKEPEPPCCLAV
ncbi:uncharacterized protein BDR25DRAFT_338746 [Lindgomyces ingoldianus]|uniref:Uncharacterized protein n=1 Tax=Lindgomyces ingoldianus TaxID=673940 RepID=A0ACB6RIC9_9PLEO|nr:uncharacterized protein BDR25DRAFT_338746 [Lindgomyces ingoldianus]KAF2478072.1 hypothetical protein BDR25DRAFT_338746 [Lindgomyces ingoldianus]